MPSLKFGCPSHITCRLNVYVLLAGKSVILSICELCSEEDCILLCSDYTYRPLWFLRWFSLDVRLSIKESNVFYASVFYFFCSGAFFFVVFCYSTAIPKTDNGDRSCRIIFV
jgi:hypothetical protein